MVVNEDKITISNAFIKMLTEQWLWSATSSRLNWSSQTSMSSKLEIYSLLDAICGLILLVIDLGFSNDVMQLMITNIECARTKQLACYVSI